MHDARSTFFADPDRFPVGTATFDGALLMRGVPVTWRPLAAMDVSQSVQLSSADRSWSGA